ncbi:coiled-coil domain-containing protein 157 isoform X2 [Nematostella vectensis]|nr:coiled-coil domain-containing protein 157 isoform X2 [Nematostella vectensis]
MEDTIGDLRDEIKMFKQVLDKKRGKHTSVSGKIKSHGQSASSARFILSPTESLNLRSPSPSHDMTLLVEDVAFAKTLQESATQTYDTAFIPCEACSRTQQNLLDVGNMVMNLCESQGLLSSLAKQKKLLRKSLMAAADISRWASEQNQDLARINSHLDNLYAQINPLEAKLKSSEERCQSLQKEIKSLEDDFNVERDQMKEREGEFKQKLQKIVEDKDTLLSDAADANKTLEEGKKMLQDMVAKLNITIKSQKETMKKLETENSGLAASFEKECKEVERLKGVDEEIVNIKIELNDVQIKLRETSMELGKTQAKNRSLIKHEQALQGKHDTLLQRVDELDSECEDLRGRLMDVEGERDDLQDSLETAEGKTIKLTQELDEKMKLIAGIKEEKQGLVAEVEHLQKSSEELQQQLTDTEEKLQMVMEYPTMDGSTGHGDANGGGEVTELDVVKDMERQVMANNIRIQLLEEQNDKLRSSITLLMNASANAPRKTAQDPMTLWRPQSSYKDDKRKYRTPSPGCFIDSPPQDKTSKRPPSAQRQLSAVDEYTTFLVQPRPPPKPRAESAKTRHHSPGASRLQEKRDSASLSAKLAASRNHVRDHVQPEDEVFSKPRVKEGKNRVKSPSGYSPVDMFVCSGCDKMYNSQKDLDIHKSFCYGNVMAMS